MTKTSHDIFIEYLKKIPKETELWVENSFILADKIAALMEQKRLSKADMAEIFKVDEDTVAWWIGGTYNFDLKTLAELSVFFDESLITINL